MEYGIIRYTAYNDNNETITECAFYFIGLQKAELESASASRRRALSNEHGSNHLFMTNMFWNHKFILQFLLIYNRSTRKNKKLGRLRFHYDNEYKNDEEISLSFSLRFCTQSDETHTTAISYNDNE